MSRALAASKRIVVWDNTIADMTTPEIVYVAGHEMGHYVLKHIAKGMIFFAVLLLIAFYLGYRTVGWVLSRFEARWEIRGLDDWASLPVLLLLLSIFSFVVTPIGFRLQSPPRAPGRPVRARSHPRASLPIRAR